MKCDEARLLMMGYLDGELKDDDICKHARNAAPNGNRLKN